MDGVAMPSPSPSSEYQKGFWRLLFSVGEAKLMEVSDDDNLTVDDTESSESYALKSKNNYNKRLHSCRNRG